MIATPHGGEGGAGWCGPSECVCRILVCPVKYHPLFFKRICKHGAVTSSAERKLKWESAKTVYSPLLMLRKSCDRPRGGLTHQIEEERDRARRERRPPSPAPSLLHVHAHLGPSRGRRGAPGRGRMVERKDPPILSSDKVEEPYLAVPSQTQPEANGVIRESYQKSRDQLVPVTLLAIAVILAFAMGAIFSGLIVYCVCDHRRRDVDTAGRKEKEGHHAHSRRGSMNSVTKLSGLFETQAKDGRTEAILTPLMHNGRLAASAKMLIKADQHHLDLTALPTPESTPMQPRRKPSRGSREWERNQNLINACTKDMAPMGSPVISDLPLRASPGHIPSVVVLPLPQHQHQLQSHLQAYQHEYVEQPHHSDMALGHMDEAATLEYKTVKNHSHNMVDPDGMLPPRVPQREASLSIPPAVPQMGKRLEVHSSVYGLRKGSASSASGSSALKKHNTNSSNSSHLARHHSFNRVETPPPAPQRVDSIQMTAQGMSLSSRQPGVSAYGSLTRTGIKHLKPDVPPKPSVVSLSTKVKSSDCT
ncbi:hypothetical protein WMY93_004411 [Mugilogobius chulae]|uniref:Semaphorin 6A n=1 Tax=Mugilogobius chulae TaxID=88201 RepID=A0AAW0Q3D8_9GOBI